MKFLTFFIPLVLLGQTAQFPGAIATDQQLGIVGNGVTGTLNNTVSNNATNIVLKNGTCTRNGVSTACIAAFQANMFITLDSEIMQICSLSALTLTTTLQLGNIGSSCPSINGRGLDGSTKVAHNVLTSLVRNNIIAWNMNAANKEIEAIEANADRKFNIRTYGALGDDSHDDTTNIQDTIDAACVVASGLSNTLSAIVTIPATTSRYKVTATLSRCARVWIEGLRATIHYTGTGPLFDLTASSMGAVHGLYMVGEGIANTWAIKCTGINSGASGCINERWFDNYIINFGDASTHSGGGYWNAANSEQIEISKSFIAVNGTGVLFTAGGDNASIHHLDINALSAGRCIDISNTIGTANIHIWQTNQVCNGGGTRLQGTGSFIFGPANEYEPTGNVTNANNAGHEFLGGTGTIFVSIFGNHTAMHDYMKYGFYVDPNSATSRIYDNNCVPMQSGGGQQQFCISNGNGNASNKYFANGLYLPAPNAALYEFPTDSGVLPDTLSSVNLSDVKDILRATVPFTSVNTVSAASWASANGGTITWTVVGSSIKDTQLVSVVSAVPIGYNTAVCSATAISSSQFSCTNQGQDPGTWSSGGTLYKASQTTLHYGDLVINPFDLSVFLNRKATGGGNTAWGFAVQNAGATDASTFGQTSSSYSGLSWLCASCGYIYSPTTFRIGTASSVAPDIALLNGGIGVGVIPSSGQAGVAIKRVTNSTYGSVPVGSFSYCTDCTISACATPGTGAWVFKSTAATVCPF